MKKENKYKCIIILLVILIVIVSWSSIKFSRKINDLPKRVCHTEYKVHKMVIGCYMVAQEIPANAERICDEGVSGATEKIDFANIVWDCNPDNIERICLYKEEIEKCEII